MTRWIYGWVLSVLGLLVILVPACNQFSKVADEGRAVTQSVVKGIKDTVNNARAVSSQHTAFKETRAVLDRNLSEITIGTWNIQRFGKTKMSNTKVMQTLVSVARQFDVLAIQEIQSRNDQTFIQRYVDMINADGSQYSYILSPVLGTLRYSEQYAFIYDTSRIELVDEGAIVPDPQDLLNREPMFSLFRTRTSVPSQAFSFAVANVHLAPNESRSELATLYEVYLWLQSYLGQYEDDVILLGDFNEPPKRYGQLWNIQSLAMALQESTMTNTRQTEAYDNILFDTRFTSEFTRKSGVIDLQSAFGLTLEEADDVSDHLPVWASFSVGEGIPATQYARQPSGVR